MHEPVRRQRSPVVEAELCVVEHRSPAGRAPDEHLAPFAPLSLQYVHAAPPTSPSNQMWMLPVPRAFSYSESATPGVRQAAPPRAPIICR